MDFKVFIVTCYLSTLVTHGLSIVFLISGFAYTIILVLYRHPSYESSRKSFRCPVPLVVFRVFMATGYLATVMICGSSCPATLVASRASSLLIV